jgi:hypothetical protein
MGCAVTVSSATGFVFDVLFLVTANSIALNSQ